MGKVLALMNEKGGVGKSSLTFSCAWKLTELGHKVLMIDLDGQMANLTYIAGVETNASMMTMSDVLLRDANIADGICCLEKSPNQNLYLMPASVSMADAMTSAKISRMKKVIVGIKDNYDYIFLDVNPAPDWKHALTLSVLDYVGIVMLPDVLSLEANRGIVDSIEEVQEAINPDLKIMGLILNRYDGRTNLSKAVMEKAQQMADYMHTKIFDAKIRKAVAMGESAFSHVGVTEYAPSAAVAEDICALTKEIEQEVC